MGLGLDDLTCHRDQPRVSAPGGFPGPRGPPVYQAPQALVRVPGAHPLDSAAGDAEFIGLGLGALCHGPCLWVVPRTRRRARLRVRRQAGLDLHHMAFPVTRGGEDLLRQAVQQPERLDPGNRVAAGHPAGCWSRACAPPAARSTPSTRCRSPATGTGTRSRAANPTTATHSSWPTCCAPTCTRTGRCPPTLSWPRPSRCWPAPSKNAVWDRTTAHNKLRSHLREYYPGFLAAFPARAGILRPEARTILAAAPTPAAAATLTLTQLRALLRKAGRSRGIDTEAARLRDAFRVPQMRQLPLVEHAIGRQTLACSASSTPPAPPQPTSSTPPPSLLTCTRTPGSSPASQGSAH